MHMHQGAKWKYTNKQDKGRLFSKSQVESTHGGERMKTGLLMSKMDYERESEKQKQKGNRANARRDKKKQGKQG